MGLLVEGEWRDRWYDTKGSGGRFVRQESAFRDAVRAVAGAPEGRIATVTYENYSVRLVEPGSWEKVDPKSVHEAPVQTAFYTPHGHLVTASRDGAKASSVCTSIAAPSTGPPWWSMCAPSGHTR